ncbi:MAG: TonB-dependent receptor [Bacteroidales bacterium 45-6]|nr:MAG: TonB-dependent receptor [Bacteroidales bacterium 45-6]
MSSTLVANVDVANKLGMTVKGVVVDDSNKPVAGVVVNDGENFTATDASGIYYLPSNLARCKYVRISIPADYEIEKNVVSSFYSKLSNKEDVNRRDFKLKKRKSNSNEFVFLAISDPQVKSKAHLARLDSETIADLKQTIRENRTKNIYAITLGDNVFDEMELFEPYRAMLSSLSVPVFSVIGNHDFDLRYNDLHNTKDSSGNYAEEIYESYFGPADYSFNIGNIHVVAMKNIDYFAGKKYTERFTPEQFEWLKKDLSYVKPGTTVFLNVHAPTSNKSSEGSGNSKNTPELLDILKGYKVHIFSGHTHFYENEEPVAGIYDHNIGAACGAWWAGSVNRCGAPNGYLVVNVKGDDVKWHYKSTGKDNSYQFRIYKPGEFATQADYLVANIWDWDSSYQVKWYEDGKLRGTMEQFDDEDQDFITMKKGKATGYHTLHLFRVKPNKDAKKITVEVKNRFGETFSESVKL